MRIGIVCYPSIGGSGIVASEIGLFMAHRGHSVHFFCSGLPHRLSGLEERIFVHEVRTLDYSVFPDSQYDIALASKIIDVHKSTPLDVLHVHYAVPHATSAYLAKQALGLNRTWVITTLHGTDITLVGRDPSFLPITKFSILQSDRLTCPSNDLKEATYDNLGISREKEIEVIPNFVNTSLYAPVSNPVKPSTWCKGNPEKKTLTHVSNFRPVKRVSDVFEVFLKVREEHPCHLVLVGDGPERGKIEARVRELGVGDDVCFLGPRNNFVEVLQFTDVFLLPSEEESFGLAALEAQSSGVPVVASKVGGIPEVVADGETGFLCGVGDVKALSDSVLRLFQDDKLHRCMADAARKRAVDVFRQEVVVPKYEELYLSCL